MSAWSGSLSIVGRRAGCAALGLLLLAGCTADDSPRAIRFALNTAPVSFDPRQATDAVSSRLNRLLYAQLVDFDAHSRAVPALADWQQLSAIQYRFTLGPQRRRFHDGSRLLATDVVATYRAVLDPATASPYRAPLAHIARIVARDDDTLDFFLSRPDPLFVDRLTIGILPASLIGSGHDFDRQPVGSGPFRLRSTQGMADTVFERLDDGQRFRFLEVREPTVRALKLLRGEVDMLQNDIAPELVDWLGERPGISLLRAAGGNYTYLGLNHAEPLLADRRVRQALSCAIDRQSLIKYLLAATARPAQSLLPPEHWAGHAGLRTMPCNAGDARRLLREAGYDAPHRPRLVYKTSTDPLRVRLATVIADQLNRAGFAVRVQSLDWGTFYADIKSGNFELYSLTWVGIRSPDSFEYIFHSKSVPPQGANRGRYHNPSVDAAIDKALATPDREAMLPHLQQVQELLNDDLAYIPLWYEQHVAAMRDTISGYTLNAEGNYDGLLSVQRHTAVGQVETPPAVVVN